MTELTEFEGTCLYFTACSVLPHSLSCDTCGMAVLRMDGHRARLHRPLPQKPLKVFSISLSSHFLSVSLCRSLFLSVSLRSLCVSLCLSVCRSLSLSASLSRFLSLSLSVPPSLFLFSIHLVLSLEHGFSSLDCRTRHNVAWQPRLLEVFAGRWNPRQPQSALRSKSGLLTRCLCIGSLSFLLHLGVEMTQDASGNRKRSHVVHLGILPSPFRRVVIFPRCVHDSRTWSMFLQV